MIIYKMQYLDIHLGEGVGPIKLGMRPDEVLVLMNEPQLYEDWMGGNLNDALLFCGLRFHFNECNSKAPLPESRLNWIVIHHRPNIFMFDRPLNEWTKETVLAELILRNFNASIHLNGDVCVNKQLGLSFDDDGYLVWVEIY